MATADAESPVRVGKKRSFDAAFTLCTRARLLLVVRTSAPALIKTNSIRPSQRVNN